MKKYREVTKEEYKIFTDMSEFYGLIDVDSSGYYREYYVLGSVYEGQQIWEDIIGGAVAYYDKPANKYYIDDNF